MFSGNQNLPFALEDSWIEISPYQIKTLSDKDSFCILRREIGEHELTWVGLYRSAREIGQSRAGGIYGAGFWLVDCAADARHLIPVMKNLADQIHAKAMMEDKFIKRLVDVKSDITIPTSAASISASVSKLTGGLSSSGTVGFICSDGNNEEVIRWAQQARAAESFSKLLVGGKDQVVTANSDISSAHVYPSLLAVIESAYNKKLSELLAKKEELGKNMKETDLLRRKLEAKDIELADMDRKLDVANNAYYRSKQEVELRDRRISDLELASRVVRPVDSPPNSIRSGAAAASPQPQTRLQSTPQPQSPSQSNHQVNPFTSAENTQPGRKNSITHSGSTSNLKRVNKPSLWDSIKNDKIFIALLTAIVLVIIVVIFLLNSRKHYANSNLEQHAESPHAQAEKDQALTPGVLNSPPIQNAKSSDPECKPVANVRDPKAKDQFVDSRCNPSVGVENDVTKPGKNDEKSKTSSPPDKKQPAAKPGDKSK
jgi:hypothetical protein